MRALTSIYWILGLYSDHCTCTSPRPRFAYATMGEPPQKKCVRPNAGHIRKDSPCGLRRPAIPLRPLGTWRYRGARELLRWSGWCGSGRSRHVGINLRLAVARKSGLAVAGAGVAVAGVGALGLAVAVTRFGASGPAVTRAGVGALRDRTCYFERLVALAIFRLLR